ISGGVVTGFTITNGGAGYTAAPNVLFNGTNSYSTSHGIRHLSTGAVTISNNNIGSITAIGTNSYSHCFESIVISGNASTIILTNNLIGSLTTANSIQTSSTATASLIKQDLRGIYINSSVNTSTISGNTISNLTNSYLGSSVSRLDGIYTSGGSNTIQNNIINNLSADGASVLVKGIQQGGTSSGTIQTLTGNTVYNLYNNSGSGNVIVSGIQFSGSTSTSNNVSQNFVHTLSVVSTNTSSEIDGIVLGGGVVTCANNIINLGIGITTGYKIYGIYDNCSGIIANNSNIFFNSIYITGSVSAGATSSTAALWNSNNTLIRNYKNNILMNLRSGGSGGVHYAIRSAGTNGLTINYNDYYVSGSGILGNISGADKSTLALWQTATGQDAQSLDLDPLFANAGGISVVDYMINATLNGTTIGAVTTDYAGITRGAIPKMGALESNSFVWKGSTSTDFATASNWIGGVIPLSGANIIFDASPANNCVLDQNRTVNNITNAQSTYKLVANGFQLKINGSLIFSNGAQIDATAASSEVAFAGSAAQNIPAGSFFSNTIDSLKINNANGLTLNGDLTINNGIALNVGNFAIGPNTLTFNGIVTAMNGSVTGGSSTNMIIGGSGGSISMPNFTLNNLTINRASGVNLYGDLNLVGTLSLTSGTLTVGPNTLTISGNSPTRTTGNVDVSNSSANLVFNNVAAMVLPASIFSGSINNLAINGAGGITIGDDLVINGILNLANVNPSGTKGLLDMWNGSAMKTITMNSSATTIGLGDVTGIIKRTTFIPNVCYSFGNQYTCMTFSSSGTVPTEIDLKINIGTAPSWKTDAIQRYYDILRVGGTSSNLVTLSLHYLDSELNSNPESNLVTWDFHPSIPKLEEHGKATNSSTDNWIMISNRSVTYFDGTYDTHPWTISNSITPDFTWQGSSSSDWTDQNNWSGNICPISTSDVTIPDASTTLNDPILPASTSIKTLTLSNGAILNGGTSTTLTVTGSSGAWYNDGGVFVPGTSTLVFTHTNATISGINSFNNLTINTGAALTTEPSSVTKIAGTMTNNGLWHTVVSGQTTVEYNGADQTIVVPNPATNRYCNLVLSGSGIKTLPSSAMTITCDLKISGTASAVGKANININGSLIIESGATFETGAFNHNIAGNLTNDGTFTATSGSTLTMCGSNSAQFIEGASSLTTLHNLNVNNSFTSGGVSITVPTTITNTLTLTSKPVYTYLDKPFTLAAGSSVSPDGGSVSSFVDGPLLKEGATAFIFPLGNGTRWARLGIGTPTASTTFRAQYFASADTNTSYMSQIVIPVLQNVSTQEYWKLDRTLGTGNAAVTLYWEDAAWSGINDCANLRIAHRNTVDSTWENNNDAVTTTGSCTGATSGSITTDAVVTSFSPFTFGSLSSAINPLPVEMMNFNAECLNNHTKLLWQTASEMNNDYFEIEQSENSEDWQSIGKVKGNGNSNTIINYSFIDEISNNITTYYRLKQVDFDGKFNYSKIVFSKCNEKEISILVLPNPTNDYVKINLSENRKGMSFQLYSGNGRQLKESKIESVETFIDLRNFSSATYYLKVIDEKQEVKVFKIIKY
ncbi:MAG: T9SS type A sorting domain-containing protein, partial [Bacteroidetes bacterium]|nr:T9SS type A sorting domain-containing protein [Bacteroidota bacterium]